MNLRILTLVCIGIIILVLSFKVIGVLIGLMKILFWPALIILIIIAAYTYLKNN